MKKKTSPSLKQLEAQFERRRQQLAQIGYLTQGTVFRRKSGQQGSLYCWTRKLEGKTVTVALSAEQFLPFKEAVANHRRLQKILQQMQQISRQILFASVPGVTRRKRLSKKVLGLN